MSTLTCPKCTADMRSYERNRVLVDQCTGCGGLFLDRGELEKLVAAENEWHAGPAAPAAAPAPTPVPQDRRPEPGYREPSWDERRSDRGYERGHDTRGHDNRGYDNRRYDNRGYDPRYDKKRKKKSFLSELFDD